MPPKKGKEVVVEAEPEPTGPLDLNPLSEQLRSADEVVLKEGLEKVLTLSFDEEYVGPALSLPCPSPSLSTPGRERCT
jgi:hypothetical protein